MPRELSQHRARTRVLDACFVYLVAGVFPETVPTRFGFVGLVDIAAILVILGILIQTNGRSLSGPRDRRAPFLAILFTMCLFLAFVWGVIHNQDASMSFSEYRPSLTVLIVGLAAYFLALQGEIARLVPALMITMVVSASFTVILPVIGVPLEGRSEAAQLYASSGGYLGEVSEASRHITVSSQVAMFVIGGLLCLYLSGKRLRVIHYSGLVAAVVIAFLAFSRYQVIGIGAAVVVAGLYSGLTGARAFFKFLRRSGLLVIASGAAIAAAAYLDPRGLGAQINAFSSRVIAGLTPGVRAEDSSFSDRAVEQEYLLEAISRSPFFGNGLGYAYKPWGTGAGQFAMEQGQYYAHNYYLWVWAKAGILSLVLLAALLVVLLARIWRIRADPRNYALMAPLVALVPTLWVSPLLNSQANAASTGALLGIAIAASTLTAASDPNVPLAPKAESK